jgi:hypothetical protein
MAKAAKKKTPKKREKRTIDIDTNLTFEQALKLAATTPIKKNKK